MTIKLIDLEKYRLSHRLRRWRWVGRRLLFVHVAYARMIGLYESFEMAFVISSSSLRTLPVNNLFRAVLDEAARNVAVNEKPMLVNSFKSSRTIPIASEIRAVD